MIIQSLIDKKIEPLGLGATLKEVHERIKESGCGAVAFIDEESRPVGILTERDISRLLFEGCGFDDLAFPLAIKELVVSQENRDLEYVLSLMTGNNIRRIVICNKVGQYSGIITQDTIFHELGEEIYKTKLRARHLINAKNLIHKITPSHSLKEALSLMVENKIGTLPMLGEGERILGMLTERKIVRMVELGVSLESPAVEFIDKNPHLVHEDSFINEIIDIFEKNSDSLCVLVIDSSRELKGIITKRDLLKNAENSYKNAIEESFRATRYALNNFPQSVLECYYLETTMLIQWANKRAFELLGSDIVDKPLSAILDQATYEHMAERIAAGLRVEPFNIEIGGNYYEVTLAKSTRRIMQLVFTDVTKHKEYEETLRKERQVVQDILDFQSSIVLVAGSDEGVLSANRSALDFFGFRDVKEFRMHYRCICEAFIDREGFLKNHHEAWLHEVLLSSQTGRDSKAIIKDRHSGEERIFVVKVGHYPRDSHKFIVSLTDVTELEMSKRELEGKVMARTAELSRAMSILEEAQKIARLGNWQLYLHNAEFEYSKEITKILGIDEEDRLSIKDLMSFVHPEDKRRLMRGFIRSAKKGQNASCNIRFLNLYGQTRMTHIQIKAPNEWHEEKILFGICQDITEQIELEKIAYYDSLTQIYNRNKFNELITREIELLKRYKQPLSLVIFDIDRFKRINDTYGHRVGDEVLAELAGIVSREIRSTDIFVRWGGEEFVIVTPQTPTQGAQLLAEKIRSKIEEWKFEGVEECVTCSFGVTNILRLESIESAIERADELLYKAKNNGRNQVVMAEER